MLILIHIAAALTSLAVCSLAALRPSRAKINASYGLTCLTIASGTYIAISRSTRILPTCFTGLVYLGFILGGLVVARRRLASYDKLI